MYPELATAFKEIQGDAATGEGPGRGFLGLVDPVVHNPPFWYFHKVEISHWARVAFPPAGFTFLQWV